MIPEAKSKYIPINSYQLILLAAPRNNFCSDFNVFIGLFIIFRTLPYMHVYSGKIQFIFDFELYKNYMTFFVPSTLF